MEIILVTGNKDKLAQARATFARHNISVISNEAQVDEIQSKDPIAITKAKAKECFKAIKKPLIVSDHSWAISALNGFPGGYAKDVNQWFTAENFLALMDQQIDRNVYLTECLVYQDEEVSKIFITKHAGEVSFTKKGTGRVPFEQVIRLSGSSKTIAEIIDNGKQAIANEQSSWEKFAIWYKDFSKASK